MPGMDSNLELLRRHLDLVPKTRLPLARWMCESWQPGVRVPRWLDRVSRQAFAFSLNAPDAAEQALREMVLALLSTHRVVIARRNRTGALDGLPLGPRRLEDGKP